MIPIDLARIRASVYEWLDFSYAKANKDIDVQECAVDAQHGNCCQLCGNSELTRFEIPNQILLWKCEPCELFQFGVPAADQAYAKQYHAGYAKHREQKIRTAIYRLNRAACYVDAPRPRLLDVGCSVGCTVEAAKLRGWNACGVDVSDDAVDYCRQRGLDCYSVDSLRLPFEDHSFDVLVSWHVIEHVSDAAETLAEWRRVLKPNGLMVLETPDASSPKVRKLGAQYRKFWAPEHTYTFTPENLAVFMRRAGMKIVREPKTGALGNLGLRMGAYSAVYHSYLSMRKQLGIHKAFQLFAQRIPESDAEARAAA